MGGKKEVHRSTGKKEKEGVVVAAISVCSRRRRGKEGEKHGGQRESLHAFYLSKEGRKRGGTEERGKKVKRFYLRGG